MIVSPAGVTVTVEPGVTFRIQPNVGFLVLGRLLANGLSDRRISFLPAEPTPDVSVETTGESAHVNLLTTRSVATESLRS